MIAASDCTPDRRLDHARSTRHTAADVEAAHRSARNRERAARRRVPETESATVDGFNGAAHELPAVRSLLLAIRLGNPDPNPRARLHVGGKLCDGETGRGEEEADDDEQGALLGPS